MINHWQGYCIYCNMNLEKLTPEQLKVVNGIKIMIKVAKRVLKEKDRQDKK